MATFTNSATLSYNGNVTTSNIVTGTLQEVLSATKTAVIDSYGVGDSVTYIVSLVNGGTSALNNLTLTDDLGGYTVAPLTVYPLTYVTGSVKYFVNGVLQTAPAQGEGPELVFTGINVPAGGNASIIYDATVNQFAPLAQDSTITNTANVSGGGLSTLIAASETITAADDPLLTISKALSPAVVTDNGQLTYTFTIQNTGNSPATSDANIVITDIFDPILDPITVTFNGTPWTSPTNYTYNTATGLFTTVSGQVTVPAATYTQDPTTGAVTITPGVSTLVVTGTV